LEWTWVIGINKYNWYGRPNEHNIDNTIKPYSWCIRTLLIYMELQRLYSTDILRLENQHIYLVYGWGGIVLNKNY
jgi:hypothetical protein